MPMFVVCIQVTFDHEGTMKAILSTKNYRGDNEFSKHFEGKIVAVDFCGVWIKVTTLNTDKENRVAAGRDGMII